MPARLTRHVAVGAHQVTVRSYLIVILLTRCGQAIAAVVRLSMRETVVVTKVVVPSHGTAPMPAAAAVAVAAEHGWTN